MWQPDAAGLQEVVHLLKESQSPDNEVQRRIQAKLDQLNHHPDFNNYLIYVLTRCNNENDPTRSLAGLILKNNIRVRWREFHTSTKALIKSECLNSIGDRSPLIRTTVGILITTIVTEGGLQEWNELLPRMNALLNSANPDELEGAFNALQKICEDSTELDSNESSSPESKPLDIFVPKFIQFFGHGSVKIRGYALSCINCYILHRINAILPHADVFLQRLFALAGDTDLEVQKQLLRAVVGLIDVQPAMLLRDLGNVISFMLMKTQDRDETIAMEACEFWLTIAENQECQQFLLPYLPQLIPVLVSQMKYSPMDMTLLLADEEDEMKPDLPQDMKPKFHKSKAHSLDHAAGPSGDHRAPADEDEEDADDDDEVSEWNLRKCAAAGLDVLSNVFQNHLLPILLPVLKQCLTNSDWLVRESGILALGAIGEGCADGMAAHLADLVPFLVDHCLNDAKPLVRSITCWTLSRYSSWIVSEGPDRYFPVVLREFLVRVLDKNKKVQEAACSAFATLEEEAGNMLSPYLDNIVSTLVQALRKYQSRNLMILYDALGTLAESVGSELNRPDYVRAIMDPLITKWSGLGATDKSVFGLLECMSSVATAMGPGFLPYAEPVFNQALILIDRSIQEQMVYAQHPDLVEVPDRDCLIVALDLISGMSEGIGDRIEPLVTRSNLMATICQCVKDQVPEVRQSAFALVGDLARAAFNAEKPYLTELVAAMSRNMDPEFVSVCNNAIWALGEVAIRIGAEIRPFVPMFLQPLMILMMRPTTQKTLQENTAITLGRLGLVCPDLVAPQIPHFMKQWTVALRNVRDNEEKASAFRGLCVAIGTQHISLNPADLVALCDGAASWTNPDPHLKSMIQQILMSHRQKLSAGQWAEILGQLAPLSRERLQKLYGA